MILIILPLTALALLGPEEAPATFLFWRAQESGLMDENYAYLEDGDMVQLIWVGPDGQIDPPDITTGLPGGDDVLLSEAAISGNEGEFTSGLEVAGGTVVYVRFFNSNSPGTVTYYGLSALHTVLPDEAFFDVWDITAGGLYLWTVYRFIVIPEPETYLTLLPALGLGVFIYIRSRRKKKT